MSAHPINCLGVALKMASWLTVDFHPGFSEDLTSWQTEIDRSGQLLQTVNIRRFSPYEERKEFHSCELTPQQMQELEELILAIDFASIREASKKFGIDDAALIHIVVDGSSEKTVSGALMWWDYAQKKDKTIFCSAVPDALRLWRAIDRLSPHKLCARQ